MTINRDDPKFNRYPGRCSECKQLIPAGKGMIERNGQGGWDVLHFGQCPLPIEPPKPSPVVQVDAVASVPDGTYTVIFSDDSYKTLRLLTQRENATFKPGQQLIAFLSGSDNEHDYTRVGHVDVLETETGVSYQPRIWRRHAGNTSLVEAVKVLFNDPKAAAQAYAERSHRCARCGRTLTVPASLYAGVGPECSRKLQEIGW